VAAAGPGAVSDQYWRWGEDNQLPAGLLRLAHHSSTHRRILNDKADYIAGNGFSYAPEAEALGAFVGLANGIGESLRRVVRKVAFDRLLFGNAFIEVITDKRSSFLSLFHQDASRCRLSKDERSVLLHHDWSRFSAKDAKKLPLWPNFSAGPGGTMRSILHLKNYEPMMEHYGVPAYVAGMNAANIVCKTDRWNLSRLESSFQLSGVMVLDGSVENDQQASEIVKVAESRFAGHPGQVMFVVKDAGEQEYSKFIPIETANEGDWKGLHQQAATDIVVAHSWYRTLSGLDYSAGFSSERVMHEYEVALNTLILPAQEELLEHLRSVMARVAGIDASSLQMVNVPPASAKPDYMRVWEARKADGLPYDPADEAQQIFLSQLLHI